MSINLFDGLEWDEPNFLSDNDITLSDVPEFAVLSDGKVWISTRDGLVGFDGLIKWLWRFLGGHRSSLKIQIGFKQ